GPVPQGPAAIVTLHVPASSPAMSNLERPGPNVAASSVASIGVCDPGPENVACSFFPTTGLPSAPTTTANRVIGAPAWGTVGSVKTMTVYGPIVRGGAAIEPPPIGAPTGTVKTVLTSSLPTS